MYPTDCVPQVLWASQNPQTRHTTKAYCVLYRVAKELTKILKPLVGKSPHHINSTHDFVEQVKQFTLTPKECLSSYDVSALFILIPIDPV